MNIFSLEQWERDSQYVNELRQRVAELEKERDAVLADVDELTYRIKKQSEVHGYEKEALRKQVEMLTDPIVRQKMLEPAPAILISMGESEIITLKAALKVARDALKGFDYDKRMEAIAEIEGVLKHA